MKPNVSKALAVLAALAVSLFHTVPAQAAGATFGALYGAASQLYVSPGIAGFIAALLALLR